jgi:hypothetical protein
MLYTRVRSGVPGVPCLGIRSGTNPGDIGHSRVKKEYVDATNRGEREILDRNNRRRIFIQARLTDTPQLGEEYRLNLQGMPEKLRKAYEEGDWDTFEGQIFEEWSYERHVLAPIALPEAWRRYEGLDWGYAAPWGVLLAAVDEDGRAWIYRELYDTRVGEAEQAQRILAAETGAQISGRYADDAMWATRGDAKPIAEVYADNGVFLTPAGKGPGSRVIGWQRIHSYLKEAPACAHHRAQGWDTCPMLHVFNVCEHLIRTLPALPYASSGPNPEDADTKAEDHLPDALRYLLLNLGNEPGWVFPSEMPADVLDGPPDPNAVDPAAAGPAVPNIGGFPILHGSSPWGAAY